jgi:hypothetical protein
MRVVAGFAVIEATMKTELCQRTRPGELFSRLRRARPTSRRRPAVELHALVRHRLRRVATRYDKLAANYLAFVAGAASDEGRRHRTRARKRSTVARASRNSSAMVFGSVGSGSTCSASDRLSGTSNCSRMTQGRGIASVRPVNRRDDQRGVRYPQPEVCSSRHHQASNPAASGILR